MIYAGYVEPALPLRFFQEPQIDEISTPRQLSGLITCRYCLQRSTRRNESILFSMSHECTTELRAVIFMVVAWFSNDHYLYSTFASPALPFQRQTSHSAHRTGRSSKAGASSSHLASRMFPRPAPQFRLPPKSPVDRPSPLSTHFLNIL